MKLQNFSASARKVSALSIQPNANARRFAYEETCRRERAALTPEAGSLRGCVPSEQTVIRLQQHAGLRPTERPSVSQATSVQPPDAEALRQALDDFVSALEVLNIEM